MKATRSQVERMKAQIEDAKGHVDREEWVPAKRKYLDLLEQARTLAIESPYPSWCLSLVHERLDEVEESFRFICEAVIADPIHSTLHDRFSEAAEAMRRRLEFSSHNEVEPQRIYAALLRAGEADADCHVAMARANLARGDLDSAWKLLESTILLEPSHVAAWRLRAEVAGRRGDAAAAAESVARAKTLESLGAPFGIPSPTTTC